MNEAIVDEELRESLETIVPKVAAMSREARIRIIAMMMILFDVENDVRSRLDRGQR